MITNIYFLRHAKSSYSPDELNRPLSEKGLMDAKKVTELLSHENITKVISSPYKRAIQTVEGTANYFGLTISIDEGFRERKLADSSVVNFEKVIIKYWENFDFSLFGGENGHLAQDRGVQALKSVLNKYCGRNVVIGTHGNIMVLIMNYYDKKYNYDFWNCLNMPDIYKLRFQDVILKDVKRILL
ncbi:MAG TPA: histidine phosphatase family protein [Clostridium sp.]|uniref:histidine phosphatase family protein n=1 Tax=Clostridium sp. TaxID=1506 RepID=UPI002F9220E9